MSFKVIYTENYANSFKKLAKRYRSLQNDLESLTASLKVNPLQGQRIGKSCYKIRIPISAKGKGKSAGARLITFVYVTKKSVYLLDIYDKSEQALISTKELSRMLEDIKN